VTPKDCEHFTPRPASIAGGGVCGRNRFGTPKATVSPGACAWCLKQDSKPVPPAPVRLSLPIILPPFVRERRAICAVCDESTNGGEPDADCRLVAAKHPGKANIKAGTRKRSLRCPLGKW
jgi:hypothetical protein